jgi:hypothetical protein
MRYSTVIRGGLTIASAIFLSASAIGQDGTAPGPAPVSGDGQAQQWMFIWKMNAAIFPSKADDDRPCPFGGEAKPYPRFSQQYIWASSGQPSLQNGPGLAGTGVTDPLGATFDRIYRGGYHFVVWNDQFYQHPQIAGCSDSCSSPWGHSKGVLAWNDAGEGMILQVTTPSWPAAGSSAQPRVGDGNTLGCIDDNNVKVSQDFFALKLSERDVENVLDALANASVVTDVSNPQLVNNGGPTAIQQRVALLGRKSPSVTVLKFDLSSGVRLIAKPSALNVPPWQLVSSELGGINLRAATWWTAPAIPSTTKATAIGCWNAGLIKPGAVQIATSGQWEGKPIGLQGGPSPDRNHAKVGVSSPAGSTLTIFGDMNQQGTLSGKCSSSQNGRGGLFFVVDNGPLHDSVSSLIAGGTASTKIFKAKKPHHCARAARAQKSRSVR